MTSHLVIYSLCSNAVLCRGILYMLLYSYAFLHRGYTSLFPCYAFCGLATHIAFLFYFLFFSTSIFGHFYLKYPTPQYLKHLTSITISFLLILTFSFTPYLITLLNNTSNLFLEISFLFFLSFLFLQLQARYHKKVTTK